MIPSNQTTTDFMVQVSWDRGSNLGSNERGPDLDDFDSFEAIQGPWGNDFPVGWLVLRVNSSGMFQQKNMGRLVETYPIHRIHGTIVLRIFTYYIHIPPLKKYNHGPWRQIYHSHGFYGYILGKSLLVL